MTELTISIPDPLMERLRPYLRNLPRVLELGVERLEQSTPSTAQSERERILRLLADKGIARPLDRRLLPPGVLTAPRQKPLVIPGKPVSEIIIEQRGPR
jgi:hypothetical protein